MSDARSAHDLVGEAITQAASEEGLPGSWILVYTVLDDEGDMATGFMTDGATPRLVHFGMLEAAKFLLMEDDED